MTRRTCCRPATRPRIRAEAAPVDRNAPDPDNILAGRVPVPMAARIADMAAAGGLWAHGDDDSRDQGWADPVAGRRLSAGDGQAASGLWVQLPDQPELTGNHDESAASAMSGRRAGLAAATATARPPGYCLTGAVVAGDAKGVGPADDGRRRAGAAVAPSHSHFRPQTPHRGNRNARRPR